MAKKDSGGQLKSKDIDRLIQQQIAANRIGQNTPTGSLDFAGGTANVTLSPAEQAILEQSQMARLLAGQTATGRFAALGTDRADVEKASFDRIANLINPQFDRREAQLRQRLANQGLPQTSRAFGAEMGRFEDTYGQALEQAALAATLAGGAEESRIVATIMSMLGLGQPAQPQFINVPQVQVPFQQPGGGGSAGPLPGLLGLAGLAAGPMTGTGVVGSQLGFTAGSQLPFLFGG